MFKIFTENSKEVTFLKLVEESGIIKLAVVNANGQIKSYILGITNQGRLSVYSDVKSNMGFQLDALGRIALAK